MDNVQFFTDTDLVTGKVTETVLIDHGNGEFTSMLKSAYEEQQAQQVKHFVEIVTPQID
jgi:hypothetical protein